jgi:hypothetical protein
MKLTYFFAVFFCPSDEILILTESEICRMFLRLLMVSHAGCSDLNITDVAFSRIVESLLRVVYAFSFECEFSDSKGTCRPDTPCILSFLAPCT